MKRQPKKLVLDEPVTLGGVTVTELTLRPPRAGDLRTLDVEREMSFGDLLDLGAKVTGQPVEIIDELDAGDCFRLVEELMGFLPRSAPGAGGG